MRTNLKLRTQEVTHEGAPAAAIGAEQALRRSVMSCLLWEKEFYEDGEDIAARIESLVPKVRPEKVAAIAIEARESGNLRHVPLLLCALLAKGYTGGSEVGRTIARVVQRADELAELLAIHARINKVDPSAIKKVIPAQMKKGLAKAFQKFDEYQLAKYDRDGAVRLRDALFLVHAKPKDEAQAGLWSRLIAGELKVPDTWEVALSSGADKKEAFERLLREEKIGYLALLRNLRNMAQAGVPDDLVRSAILARKGAHRVLPFRYVAAARAAPQHEPAVDAALLSAISEMPPLSGKTAVLIDVSGSMDAALSCKSDLRRIDAAAALGAIVSGDIRLFTFSNHLVEIPPRRGMAGVDAIIRSQPHGGTLLGQAVEKASKIDGFDRIIVVTDEQSHDRLIPPQSISKRYLINVASNKNGVGYGPWVHIDGFSESVLKFIHTSETGDSNVV